MAVVRSIAAAFEFNADPIKGSRFIAIATPADTPDSALAAVEASRLRWPGASHHCWAYALSSGPTRSSDDGEPGGSAGRPILAQIEGHDLTDVVVVVTRWFGGTKLGVGGLIRAYGGTAGKTLDRCEVVERVPTVPCAIEHAYDDTGLVQGLLAHLGQPVRDTRWGEGVTVLLDVPEDRVEALSTALRDRSSGRLEISPADE